MALTEIILAIANVVFIIIAIFLFVRLRKIGKKGEPEKKQPEEIKTITPSEFKPEKFEIKSQDIVPPEKPAAIAPDIGAIKTELKLEDELPEVKEKTAKKESKKKKAAKKVLEEVIEQAIKKETGAPSEEILIPETKEEKPEKKESQKKKPAKKEPEKVVEIKGESKAIPRKKASQKEKALPQEEKAAKAEKKPSKKKIEKK